MTICSALPPRSIYYSIGQFIAVGWVMLAQPCDRSFCRECFCREERSPFTQTKETGFLDNLCLSTDILCKNPVSEPPGGLRGSIAMYATSDKSIGKVLTTLTITNRADQSAVTRGFIPTEQIRSITLVHVLVDQGATRLCLRCCCDRHSSEN